jgi:hypothetical protein
VSIQKTTSKTAESINHPASTAAPIVSDVGSSCSNPFIAYAIAPPIPANKIVSVDAASFASVSAFYKRNRIFSIPAFSAQSCISFMSRSFLKCRVHPNMALNSDSAIKPHRQLALR